MNEYNIEREREREKKVTILLTPHDRSQRQLALILRMNIDWEHRMNYDFPGWDKHRELAKELQEVVETLESQRGS